jgi:hypothetical protein
MPKLHLVGITPDHRGLVLSEHARAKRGDMVLEIDDRLLEAIEKAQRLRSREEGHRLESAALPSKRVSANGDGSATPRLTPREIQQRLRTGESVTALARSSGTDEAWIQRFAAPVLAEQAKVVERARALTFTKRGLGPSGATLGPAVAANVIDRGVPLTLPDLEAGWGAYQRPEGGWHVTFTFPLRGRRQTAEWEFDLTTGDLTARNKLASELGWRESGKKLPQPAPAPAAPAPAPAKRARTAPATTEAGESAAGPGEETPQSLPLDDERPTSLPLGGLVRKAAPAKKAPAKKAPGSKAPPKKSASPAKRTAAAMTEAPAQSVVPVPSADPDAGSARPAGSMPPTDLDVVDVLGELPPIDDDDAVRETVVVLPTSAEDEIGVVDEFEATGEEPPEEYDPPTGPISMRARPQPAPLGAQPAPQGGPPAP